MDRELTKVDTLHGPMWVFAHDTGCSRILRTYGQYSELELALVRQHIDGSALVVDAGAHIGALTIPLARLAKHVVAVEPQAEVAEVLRANLALNAITNVEVVEKALGAEARPAVYYTLEHADLTDSLGSVHVEPEASPGCGTVEMITLDSLGLRPQFVKIDVEGFEPWVLDGAEETLRSAKPYVLMEHPGNVVPLMKIMTAFGYISCQMDFPIYPPVNYNGCTNDIFPGCAHLMMFSFPNAKATS